MKTLKEDLLACDIGRPIERSERRRKTLNNHGVSEDTTFHGDKNEFSTILTNNNGTIEIWGFGATQEKSFANAIRQLL